MSLNLIYHRILCKHKNAFGVMLDAFYMANWKVRSSLGTREISARHPSARDWIYNDGKTSKNENFKKNSTCHYSKKHGNIIFQHVQNVAWKSRAVLIKAHVNQNLLSDHGNKTDKTSLRGDGLVEFDELRMCSGDRATGGVSRQTSKARFKPVTHVLKNRNTHTRSTISVAATILTFGQ